ncbi:MAG: sensor histidine kinase [Wenzhouxiangella sp.]|jgi:two-component system sensor histidine kinase DesK|nr:sensor histidine kinase [Wenzhouxiangella sp.]
MMISAPEQKPAAPPAQACGVERSRVDARGWRVLPPEIGPAWPRFVALGFLAFLGIGYLQQAPGVLELGFTALGILVFLMAYFWAYWLDDSAYLLVPIGIIATVGVALSTWNTGAIVFFFYGAYLAGWMDRGLLSGVAIAILLTLIGLCQVFFGHPLTYLLTGVIITASISGSGFQARRLERANRALRESRAQVSALAMAAERERIARELHDALGRELSAVTLKAELAGRLLERDPDRVRQELAEIAGISRSSLEEVRRSVQGETRLDPLREALDSRALLEAAGVAAKIETPGRLPRLGAERATALGFVIREAVTNVVRHSGAAHCTIMLAEDEARHRIRLTVRDDGCGLREATPGRGLRSLSARLADLGGRLEVRGGDGTELIAELPL